MSNLHGFLHLRCDIFPPCITTRNIILTIRAMICQNLFPERFPIIEKVVYLAEIKSTSPVEEMAKNADPLLFVNTKS